MLEAKVMKVKKRYRVWVTTRDGFDLTFVTFAESEEDAKREFESKGTVRFVVEIR
jgi:hypothetical protein